MEKLIKLLRKENPREFLKLPQIKKEISEMNQILKPFHVDFPVKTIKDYYTLCISCEALKNKQEIERVYEQRRHELFEVWAMLEYPKRNEFLHPFVQEKVAKMKKFNHKGKLIFLPFFDELINALYDHETAILELPQFFKMYKQFSDKIIDPAMYGLHPYQVDFAQAQTISQHETGFSVYESKTHTLVVIFYDGMTQEIPLSLTCTADKLDPSQGAKLTEAILTKQLSVIQDAFCQSGYISEKLKKKIRKLS